MQVISEDTKQMRAISSSDIATDQMIFTHSQPAQDNVPEYVGFRSLMNTESQLLSSTKFMKRDEFSDSPTPDTPRRNIHPGVIAAIVLATLVVVSGLIACFLIKSRRAPWQKPKEQNEKRRRRGFVKFSCAYGHKLPSPKERTNPTCILPVFSQHATVISCREESSQTHTGSTQVITTLTPSVLFTSVIDTSEVFSEGPTANSPRLSYEQGYSRSRRMRSSQMISFTDRSWEDDWVHIPRRPPSAKVKERTGAA
ncbi:hypothetical protein BDY19DRAFT_621069 [Irpex rosettiformis]|uniref:Uncharacterized protein n=1 Tax=Irpex rosettiformis TaxID=378272 RepID=A0ACB8TNS1_9APHY|nr:hypothetical protein BDY19DRAFT_621069 [Irpex rosettiformis]